MKSSGEDFFASAPKQAALVKTSEIKSAWRKVIFCKVVMVPYLSFWLLSATSDAF
jgi:hypothetical protein